MQRNKQGSGGSLSEEVTHQLTFGGWINVNWANRKGRELCSIFVMKTHILIKVKSHT